MDDGPADRLAAGAEVERRAPRRKIGVIRERVVPVLLSVRRY
jgi:hypothetical protein